MTMTDLPSEYKPRLRSNIVLGPPELRGDRTVFFIKDALTDWYYRIGLVEHFFLSRMDGTRSFAEILDAYEEASGRRLEPRSETHLLELLEERQMLEGQTDPEKIANLKQRAVERRRERPFDGLLERRFRLADPDRFLSRLEACLRWALSPLFVMPALVAFVLVEIYVFGHLQELFGAALELRRRYASWVLVIVMMWGLSTFHELAHGVACKHFGGSVHDMGVVWRYFWLFPYTKLDDIAVFHNRWHRVYTAFAGIFANLMIVTALTALWIAGAPQGDLRGLLALVLTAYNFSTFRNFIPFLRLDGYFMLSHALRMPDLREESFEFWKKALRKLVLRQGEGLARYRTSVKFIYLWYGLWSFLFTLAFVQLIICFWFNLLKKYLGGLVAGVTVSLLLGRIVYRRGKRWWQTRQESKQAAARETAA
jgi:putative peptide zinc metalloprotease protein